jgi:hypothetical protein
MRNAYFIPRKDNEFLVWTKNFLHYLSATYTHFNFPKEDYDQLAEQNEDFAEKLETAEAPETRTKAAVKAKDEARKILEKNLQQKIKEYLTYNHLVTDEDRDNMGLPIHKTTRTPSPVATTYPDFDVDSGTIRRLTVHYYDQGQKKSKAKPDGQHGAEICWAILDSPPLNISDLVNSFFDTRTPLTLEFEESQRGKRVYFCLRWENTRGEKGPWSEIVSAIIP